MSGPLYIIGTAGHASDVADLVHALGYDPVFVARTSDEADASSVVGEIVVESQELFRTDAPFAIGIGDNALRAAVAGRLRSLAHFPTLIHPDTSFGRGQRERVAAASGTVVFAGVRMTGNIAMGDFCTLNLNATVSHDCELGDFVNLSPGATLAGNVRVETGAWIGTGAVVNQGEGPDRKRIIGAHCTIGSGAVVLADCDAHSTYVGVPVRKLR